MLILLYQCINISIIQIKDFQSFLQIFEMCFVKLVPEACVKKLHWKNLPIYDHLGLDLHILQVSWRIHIRTWNILAILLDNIEVFFLQSPCPFQKI